MEAIIETLKLNARLNETYPAFLFGHPGALSLVDHPALLPGDVVADLLLDSLALPLGDHLALGLSLRGADLLHDGGTLLLEPGMKRV